MKRDCRWLRWVKFLSNLDLTESQKIEILKGHFPAEAAMLGAAADTIEAVEMVLRKSTIYMYVNLHEDIFFYNIDARRSYTKKMQLLKAGIGPSIVKRRKRGDFIGRSRGYLWMRVLNS